MENTPPHDAPTLADDGPDKPAADSFAEDALDHVVGTHIGRYKLLQKIGEGGWGVVYMAEQEQPVRRRLALKIIKLGMDTKSVIARFEAERQALAMMDHPNIARVLDAGATDTGRPFFVMELVRGISVTAYCDQHNLPMAERLHLFIQICLAVQHAHQKGVIHRDLKPSNILVSHHDGRPVPKVIDFGIAKASEVRLTDKTLFTAFEQFIGTPAYMSPEQAEMGGLDIDTRSDIYSLGVLMYELLTGHTPFSSGDLAQAGIEGMRRIIREREPARPSTRLQALSQPDVTSAARRRQVEPTRLAGLIRGDLDWIVMKAIDKDRTRRYATANELAADVERFLKGEPINARPPSQLYRLHKLVRRHRIAVAAAATTVGALATGLGIAIWQYQEKKEAWEVTRDAEMAKTRLLGEARAAQESESRLRAEAERQELSARQRTYAADINLAQQALAMNNLGRAQELLAQYRPTAERPEELRGWEWRHLWQQCQSEALYTLCQEEEGVRSISVSGDGHWAALEVGRGSEIAVWDVRARREAARLNGREQAAGNPPATGPADASKPPPPPRGGRPGRRPSGIWENRSVFAPAGDTLAFARTLRTADGGETHGIRLWKASDQTVVRDIPLPASAVTLAFSTDGRTLLSMTEDNQVSLFDTSTGDRLNGQSVSIDTRFGALLRTSPDLKAMAMAEGGGNGGRLRVVETASGQERWSADTGDDWMRALTFSPDGKLLAGGTGSGTDSAIKLWDAATGRELGRLGGHRGQISGLVIWPDGTLASASEDHTIRLWSTAELRPLAVLRGHRSGIRSLALLPDGSTLLSAGSDGSVLAWDAGSLKRERPQFSLPTAVKAWCFTPDSAAVITLSPDGRLSRWHGQHFEVEEIIAETGESLPPVSRAEFSDDGRLLAMNNRDGTVVVWDVAAGIRSSELKATHGGLSLLGFIPGTTDILTEPQGPGHQMTRWDARSGKELASWPAQPVRGPKPAPGLSIDGRWLVTADEHGLSRWRDLKDGQETSLDLGLKEVRQIALSPDGRQFAAISSTGTGSLWDLASQQKIADLRGFLAGMYSAAFSPDSRRLAIGSTGEEALKIYDVASQRELVTLEGTGALYFSSRFSPDGNILAASNVQGALSFWRAPATTTIDALTPR